MREGETLMKMHDGQSSSHEDILQQYSTHENAYLMEGTMTHGKTAGAQTSIGQDTKEERATQEEDEIVGGIRHVGNNGDETHGTDRCKERAEQICNKEKVEIHLLVNMCLLQKFVEHKSLSSIVYSCYTRIASLIGSFFTFNNVSLGFNIVHATKFFQVSQVESENKRKRSRHAHSLHTSVPHPL